MTPQQAYQSGNLSQALTLAMEVVKQNPSDVGARVFFAELCCIVGDLERADKQLQTLLTLSPELALTASNWRQLIRAAYSRNGVYREGETPTLIAPATPAIELALSQLVALRDGDETAIQAGIGKSEQLAASNVIVNGKQASDIRDLDDVQTTVFEFFGTNGNYFWIDINQIEHLQFETPERPLDLLWRKCSLTVTSGSEGVVFMPAIYPNTTDDSQQLLGRSTDWKNHLGLELGLGLREFWVDDEVINIMDLNTLTRT